MPQTRVIPEEKALLMQRVADGQASDADLEQWAAMLEEDPDLLLELDGIQALSARVGAALRAEAAALPALDLERRIMRGLDDAPVGFLQKLVAGLRAYRWVLAPVMAGGFAAALAVTVPGMMTGGEDGADAPTPGQVAAAEVHGLDVDGTAVVFQASRNVTVIWVNASESRTPSELAPPQDNADDSVAQ